MVYTGFIIVLRINKPWDVRIRLWTCQSGIQTPFMSITFYNLNSKSSILISNFNRDMFWKCQSSWKWLYFKLCPSGGSNPSSTPGATPNAGDHGDRTKARPRNGGTPKGGEQCVQLTLGEVQATACRDTARANSLATKRAMVTMLNDCYNIYIYI